MSTRPIPDSWEAKKLATPGHTPEFGIYAKGETCVTAIVVGPHAEARARFIEAAPELLEALEAVLKWSGSDDSIAGPEIAARKYARAVIAKAKGEA